MNPVDVERFYAHVLKGPTPEACWLWLGAISDDGYGRFWFNTPAGQKVVSAHTTAFWVCTAVLVACAVSGFILRRGANR